MKEREDLDLHTLILQGLWTDAQSRAHRTPDVLSRDETAWGCHQTPVGDAGFERKGQIEGNAW